MYRNLAGEPRIADWDTTSQENVCSEDRLSDALHSSTPGRLEKMKKYTRGVVVKGRVSSVQLIELLMSMQHMQHLKSVVS